MTWRPVGTDGRTGRQAGRHHEASSRVPQFCERAKKTGVIYVVTIRSKAKGKGKVHEGPEVE
jgi:hypothetical protein